MSLKEGSHLNVLRPRIEIEMEMISSQNSIRNRRRKISNAMWEDILDTSSFLRSVIMTN